jgi:hypothetical protein
MEAQLFGKIENSLLDFLAENRIPAFFGRTNRK